MSTDPFPPTKSRRWTILLLAFTLVMLTPAMFSKSPPARISNNGLSMHPRAKCQSHCSEECHWYFFNYTPSAWEKSWYDNIDVLQGMVCETLANAENINRTVLSLQRLIELQTFGRNRTNSEQRINDQLLSRMFYRQRCIDPRTQVYSDVAEVSHLIEPLIGLLRDPLSICGHLDATLVPSSLYADAILLSRRFLLLSPAAPYHVSGPKTNSIIDDFSNNIPPWMYKRAMTKKESGDRKILLLDLGSSSFGSADGDIHETSGRWLYEYYKRFGLLFDRIISYEAAPLNTTNAWNELPDEVFPVYTLINTGCTLEGKLNPWTTLRRLAKPADHVVVKVDIDSFDIENILMDQVVNDSSIHSLIDELFFEHHVSVKEMLQYWRPPPGTLKDSYVLFTKLRQLGIRMHGWP